MKSTIYTYGIVSIQLLLSTCFTACETVLDDDSIVDSESTIQFSMTRGGTELNVTDNVVSGRVFFWTTDFNNPYHTADIENLNAYNTTKFNTGKVYPADGSIVSAAGYSPISNEIDISNQNRTLKITNTSAGLTDVCTSQTTIQGSLNTPFSQTLEFNHTLTKISFKAMRDYTMQNNRLVNNVQVTIPVNYLPTTWLWNNANNKYEVQSTPVATNPLAPKYSDVLIDTDTEYIITECYLMLPSDNKGIITGLKLEADLRKVGETSTEAEHKTWELIEGIQLNDENGRPVTKAEAGEAYSVVFKFSNDSFTLEARKQPWTAGGLITIPIAPGGGESNHGN